MSWLEGKHSLHWPDKGKRVMSCVSNEETKPKKKKTLYYCKKLCLWSVCYAMLQAVAYKNLTDWNWLYVYQIVCWVCNVVYSNRADHLLQSTVGCTVKLHLLWSFRTIVHAAVYNPELEMMWNMGWNHTYNLGRHQRRTQSHFYISIHF
jgi:hypothetical protein